MSETILDNDVLCGRGGATNNHTGNKKYRMLVNSSQSEYLIAKKKEKALISKRIVRLIREAGGRFLRRDDKTGLWMDVGDKKASEKTSQALREGLDVRSFLGKKPINQRRPNLSTSTSMNDDDVPRKRQKIEKTPEAHTSPALVSVAGELQALPDLEEEIASVMPGFIFHHEHVHVEPIVSTESVEV